MAVFGVLGLPDEFAGGVPREDSAALAQIAAMIDTLPEADQARLRPFITRPDQPGSIFYASPVASIAGPELGQGERVAQAPTTCGTWVNSGDLDSRFKVWACADEDAESAEIDIATIVVMIQDIWERMSNDMGGPPKPDAYGANVPADYGGDARIDFYALHMGQVVYRDGENQIPSDAAAATSPAPPYTNTDGSVRNSSSAFMLMNVDTLETDEESFKLDLIHEFFHALQLAHNFRATYQGTTEHWFVESSAVWSETYYFRAVSDDPHRWLFPFQASGLGLTSDDLDHQYASYVWPFFMEQDKNPQAIFNAWKATDPIASHDFDAVTGVVGDQVQFKTRFREFAVRNVNLNDVLRPANVTRYDELDGNFYDDSPPVSIPGAGVSPGSPYVSPDQSIPPLAARYFEPEFSEDARQVRIQINQLQPGSEVDGDFLAHYTDGSWKRLPISGFLQFCRDDDGWDIDRGYLVISNHSVEETVTGRIEIDAKERCAGDEIVLQGTFRGDGTTTPNHVNTIPDRTFGRMEVTIEVTITITPDDWTSTGTATVSGEYTGDCEYSDSDSGQLTPAGMHIFDPADPTDMIAWVRVIEYDPRFSERPLTGLYVSAFGRTADTGGTCGHVLGPVDDASPELQVSLGSCNFFEIFNNNGSWHGECSQESEMNPGTGRPYHTEHWIANLEQISPQQSPAPAP